MHTADKTNTHLLQDSTIKHVKKQRYLPAEIPGSASYDGSIKLKGCDDTVIQHPRRMTTP